ncbi:hypothetical protein NDU88_004486 [Pleurodeles waltl]|uniref:Uncharacterized protein n=1 Tax=Pleurodeles waltl TaxID=8319 RepID=A0AAV7V1D3_PLEWA|nr:hypothetical protein NDU88_004486 [Pleurodeles waltl]
MCSLSASLFTAEVTDAHRSTYRANTVEGPLFAAVSGPEGKCILFWQSPFLGEGNVSAGSCILPSNSEHEMVGLEKFLTNSEVLKGLPEATGKLMQPFFFNLTYIPNDFHLC